MERYFGSFIGCDSEYEPADFVLLGVPFDSTSSFRPGSRFGPGAIRQESFGIETYSPYQDADLLDITVYDAGDLELPFGNAQRALTEIAETTAMFLKDEKIPVLLGGEHLISLGAIQATLGKYPNLHILQFDAHADLRDEYLGEKLSHACVMRRCYDLVGDGRIHQFCIRSGTKEEFAFAASHTKLHRFDFSGLEETAQELKQSQVPVYLTIDLDCLDPSVLPGTGTPEAGGVSYQALHDAVLRCADLHIVAADVNELAPTLDASGVSTATACKLLRELFLALGTKGKEKTIE